METRNKEFKPFDRVLTKFGKVWVADIYGYNIIINHLHLTIRGVFSENEILPYEGNEHLVGTTDEPDEEVKLEKGEWVMCSMIWYELIRGYCNSRKFVRTATSQFICVEDTEDGKVEHIANYAIKFSDFNPNDMEETRKHILCVKNGKVVRYK